VDSANKLDQETYATKMGFAATANFFVLKSVFDELDGFDSALKSGGDYEFGQRLTASGRDLIFAANALVHHPARSSFGEVFKKSRRVAVGQRALRKSGKLKHGSFSWKNFFPPLSVPNDPRWHSELSLMDKLKVRMTLTAIRYINLFVRYFGGDAR